MGTKFNAGQSRGGDHVLVGQAGMPRASPVPRGSPNAHGGHQGLPHPVLWDRHLKASHNDPEALLTPFY